MVIIWGRYAELFSYDDQAEMLSLLARSGPPAMSAFAPLSGA
jgi:hypothetical protein